MKVLIGAVAVLVLMIGAQSAMASQKPYWSATDKNIQPDMKAYHLFIDGVNPVWGKNGTDNKEIMELSHDGLKLCLGDYNNDLVCRNITVTPSAFNVIYDTGFFVIPRSVNQSDLGIDLDTKYQHVGEGVGFGNGHFDIDKLYQDVITVHVCVDKYHFKQGIEKFGECWNAIS